MRLAPAKKRLAGGDRRGHGRTGAEGAEAGPEGTTGPHMGRRVSREEGRKPVGSQERERREDPEESIEPQSLRKARRGSGRTGSKDLEPGH